MNLQGAEARRKETKPHLYCPDNRCLWMTGDGRPCPRHGGPAWTEAWSKIAKRISRGEITAEQAKELV